MPTKNDLRELQALPLDLKIRKTEQRIREFVYAYGVDGVYVSYSGGKDSGVLLDIARKLYPEIPVVFLDTGIDYPEVRELARSVDGVEVLLPEMKFSEIVTWYGYPFISKEVSHLVWSARSAGPGSKTWERFTPGNAHDKRYGVKYSMERFAPLLDVDFQLGAYCCKIMKKNPFHRYTKRTGRKPIIGTLAEESELRKSQWLRNGCNSWFNEIPSSAPLSFWTAQDVLQYTSGEGLRLASVYGEITGDGCKLKTTGCQRVGCVFCGFGAHHDQGESRYEILKRTHPLLYERCMDGGAYDDSGVWRPDRRGLGMAHCIKVLNDLYGKDGKPFIRF